MQTRKFLISIFVVLSVTSVPSLASVASREAETAVKFAARKFGIETAETTAERLTVLATKYGEKEILQGFKEMGPQYIRLIESTGEEAPQAVKWLTRYGEKAIPIVSGRSAH